MLTLDQELDRLIESLPAIAERKKYWLIRTQQGRLYESFRENGFIAIEHDEVPLSTIMQLKKDFGHDYKLLRNSIRDLLIKKNLKQIEEKLIHSDELLSLKSAGLSASQIIKFAFEIKAGDVIIIPSFNSDVISFGEASEAFIGEFTQEELRRMDCDYILKKRVKWIKDIQRSDLDPFFYNLFFAHQAVNEVSKYANTIERSLNNFYIIDENAHLILDVTTQHEILAADLFGLGSDLLRLVDDFAAYAHVKVSSKDIQVSINLNSPGKIDLKSKFKKSTVVLGLIVLIGGGGYTEATWSLKTEGIPGIITKITEFLDHKSERDLKQEMFHTYKDSLNVKDPEDLIKLMKQVSDNKDSKK